MKKVNTFYFIKILTIFVLIGMMGILATRIKGSETTATASVKH